MSLDIAAIANSKATNPEDLWNCPDEADFTYRNDHERFERDLDIYGDLIEKYQDARGQLKTFHIGYGAFHTLRMGLSKLLGFHYYKEDPNDPFDLWLEMDRKDTPEAQLIQDFLLHSDCDGVLDAKHVKELAKELDKLESSQMSAIQHLPEFYDFAKVSAANDLMWEFG